MTTSDILSNISLNENKIQSLIKTICDENCFHGMKKNQIYYVLKTFLHQIDNVDCFDARLKNELIDALMSSIIKTLINDYDGLKETLEYIKSWIRIHYKQNHNLDDITNDLTCLNLK